VLKPGANIHDCEAAHIVVANIQQFGRTTSQWYEQLPADFFKMILIDEGHHNVAPSWVRLCDFFKDAKVVSYTATPLRADGQQVIGKRVYNFGYARSMMMGYIAPIESVLVSPTTISFTIGKSKNTLSLEQVLSMREKDWFSRGIALSEVCNRHIVQASIRQLNEVRAHGSPRQIIASACSIRHATQVAQLYHEYGLKAEVLHSNLPREERNRIEAALRSGLIDIVAQVQILSEGYDLGTLSVAAVFRPYRSLSPYIQFLGRILRLADPSVSYSPSNKVYIVSHVGLNDERWWKDFTNFDKNDQQYFAEYLGGGAAEQTVTESRTSPRLTLRPFMHVLNETVEKYLQKGFLKEIDESMVTHVLDTIRGHGFDPIEFGLTEEMMKQRLKMAQAQREIKALQLPVQPQRRKEALRKRVAQEGRSIADTVINRLESQHMGYGLIRHFPGRGNTNAAIVISLAQGYLNNAMGVESGERDSASIEQLQKGLDAVPDIVDSLTAFVGGKISR